MDKESLRQHAKKVRNNSNNSIISSFVCKNIKNIQEFQQAKNIMIYYPFGSEINILELLEDTSKNWFLPKVTGDEIDVYLYSKGDILSENQWRIPEPCIKEKKSEKKILDMVILPGLCADKRGFRIGYGMGFYDRFLRNLPKNCVKLIPVVSELFLDEVPKDLWDEPLDIVVTEKEIFKINA